MCSAFTTVPDICICKKYLLEEHYFQIVLQKKCTNIYHSEHGIRMSVSPTHPLSLKPRWLGFYQSFKSIFQLDRQKRTSFHIFIGHTFFLFCELISLFFYWCAYIFSYFKSPLYAKDSVTYFAIFLDILLLNFAYDILYCIENFIFL